MSIETYRLNHMGRDYEYQQHKIALYLTGWSVTTEGPGFYHQETGLTSNGAYDTAREWQKHAYVQEAEWTVSITDPDGYRTEPEPYPCTRR